jgi:hypothetical protein
MSNKSVFKDYLYDQFKKFYSDVLTHKFAPIEPPADTVTYDNTTSQISATNVQDAIDEFAQDFQDGCDTVAQAITAQGGTPADNTPQAISDAIRDLPVAMGSLKPIEFDYNIGYVSGARWTYENPTNTFSDIYEIENGKNYMIMLFSPPGTRFRAMYTQEDIRTITSGYIDGTNVVSLSDPLAGSSKNFTVTLPAGYDTGYLVVAKDNVGARNIRTALIERILKPTP